MSPADWSKFLLLLLWRAGGGMVQQSLPQKRPTMPFFGNNTQIMAIVSGVRLTAILDSARVGNSLFGFQCESLVFFYKKE